METAGEARGEGDPVFPVQQIPMLLFPPPPPFYASSSTSTPHHPSVSITSFPILVLTVLGILTTSVLLLTYYVFVIRCCLNWHSDDDGGVSRRRGRHGAASSSIPVAAVREARGLDEPAIQALPAFRYSKAAKSAADWSDCAVCLAEFQEGERVRLLPTCLHAFHVDCIDTWLQGSANCPLCRAAITSSHHCHLPLEDHQLHRPNEVVIQVGDDTEEDDTQSQHQQQEAAAESAGDAAADQQQVVSGMKRKSINIKARHDANSKGDECIDVKRSRDVPPPMRTRRSFSMDSLTLGGADAEVQNMLQSNTHVHSDGSHRGSSSSTLQRF